MDRNQKIALVIVVVTVRQGLEIWKLNKIVKDQSRVLKKLVEINNRKVIEEEWTNIVQHFDE